MGKKLRSDVVGMEGNTSISREAGVDLKVNSTEGAISRANNRREGGVGWHGVQLNKDLATGGAHCHGVDATLGWRQGD
jgi:hypothetical protein